MDRMTMKFARKLSLLDRRGFRRIAVETVTSRIDRRGRPRPRIFATRSNRPLPPGSMAVEERILEPGGTISAQALDLYREARGLHPVYSQ